MALAILKIFNRKREAGAGLEEQAATNLNIRMQRLLDLHARANVQPQELPKAGKAA